MGNFAIRDLMAEPKVPALVGHGEEAVPPKKREDEANGSGQRPPTSEPDGEKLPLDEPETKMFPELDL